MPTKPPFRADHVGSFLRPKFLLDAREQLAKGEITAAQLREVEDHAIAEIVRFQQDVGLHSITDGEFRRTYFHIDFLQQLGGVKTDIPVLVKKPDGSEELAPPVMHVVDKVRHVKDIQRADFEFLNNQLAPAAPPRSRSRRRRCCIFAAGAPASAASTIPSSTRRSTRTWRTPTATNCIRCMPPAAATCRWTTPTWPICATTRCARRRAAAATTPTSCRTATPRSSTGWWRRSPPSMMLAVHLCRGNFKSTWAAQGGYEPVAEALLTEMDVDAYFLEYDDARSGDFKPLRYLPKGKTVVLGLVTTKLGALENKDDLKRRIDEAAQYAPLEQLALSPAVRLFQHGARQRHRGGRAARQAGADRRDGARKSGAEV